MAENPMLLNALLFIAGFVLLTGGAEFLVRGASRLAARFNVSHVVIGLTIVAFGTSLPELLVSLVANLEGNGGSEIAIGNIVGSNIANLGLILGLAGLLAVIPVERHLIRREYPLMILVSVIFIAMAWNGQIGRWEGVILVIGLVAFTFYSYTNNRPDPSEGELALEVMDAIDSDIGQVSTHPVADGLFVLLGIAALAIGANWLVDSARFIAVTAGVSELVIGLTLVALGTSLPELATTLIAVYRNQGDIAVGNVVGSNLFNMMMIGGVSSLIRPLPVPTHMSSFDFPVMLGITVIGYLLVVGRPHRIARWQGGVLFLCYVAYIGLLFWINGGPA